MRLQTGDIVRFTKVQIKAIAKQSFYCNKSNQETKTTGFSISGVMGCHPYANGLIKKRFVVYREDKKTHLVGLRLFLLDNYKPQTLGSGYEMILTKLSSVKIVESIVDLRDLPLNVKNLLYNNKIKQNNIKHLLNKTSKSVNESIKFTRKNYSMLTGIPKHIQWALYTSKRVSCVHCGISLMHLGVKLYDLDLSSDKEKISDIILQILIREWSIKEGQRVNVLPIAYMCAECGASNVLVEINYDESKKKFFGHQIERAIHAVKLSKELVKNAKLIYTT